MDINPCPICGAEFKEMMNQDGTEVIAVYHKTANPNTPAVDRCPLADRTIGRVFFPTLNKRHAEPQGVAISMQVVEGYPLFNADGVGKVVDLDMINMSMTYFKERLQDMEKRQYALAYAIAGGEDVPGLLDSVPTDELVKMIRDERTNTAELQWRMDQLEK